MASLEDQASAAAIIRQLQESKQMDSFMSWLMEDPLRMSFQQSAQPVQKKVIDTTAEVVSEKVVGPATPVAAEAAPKKDERSFFRKAFDASWAGIKGGVGAGAGLFVADRVREISDKDLSLFEIDRTNGEYLKTIGAGAVGSATHNLLTDGEGGGLVQGVITGVTTEVLSGKQPITITKAAVGAIGGMAADWMKNKVFSFFGGGGDAPKLAAQQPAPMMN